MCEATLHLAVECVYIRGIYVWPSIMILDIDKMIKSFKIKQEMTSFLPSIHPSIIPSASLSPKSFVYLFACSPLLFHFLLVHLFDFRVSGTNNTSGKGRTAGNKAASWISCYLKTDCSIYQLTKSRDLTEHPKWGSLAKKGDKVSEMKEKERVKE